MDQGGTGDLHDQANAALCNPILLWRGRKREQLLNAMLSTVGCQEVGGELATSVRVQAQDRKLRVKTLAELETCSADPRDQDIRDLTLGAQGEDRASAREQSSGETRRSEERRAAVPSTQGRQVGAGEGGRGGRTPGKARDKEINPAGQLSGLRELKQPSVVETSEVALCDVRSSTLPDQSAVTSVNDIRAAKATPTPVQRVPLTDPLGRRSVLLAPATTGASTTTTAAPPPRPPQPPAAASSTATPTTASAPATSPAAAATTPTAATSPSSRATTPTTSTAPTAASPAVTATTLAPFALAAAVLARSRSSTDLLSTKEVDSSSRGGQREEGGKENTPQRTGYGGRHERHLQRLC
ncbi:unnamed protein product [Closterium sp. NIES-65]|nr:unnamed protein product [Closterium sp. NIES-65]